MKTRKICWQEFELATITLAKYLYCVEFDHIVCIGRGGFFIGDILSRIFKKPLSVLMISSYQDKNRQKELKYSNLAFIKKPKGTILIVDDLVDSGRTLDFATVYMMSRFDVKKVVTGVIFFKEDSEFIPDYYVLKTSSKVWITFPSEKFNKEKYDFLF